MSDDNLYAKNSIDYIQPLLNDSSDVFEIIDLNGTIRYISQTVERITGYHPNEMIGKNILDFIHENSANQFISMLKQILHEPGKRIKDVIHIVTMHGVHYDFVLTMTNHINNKSINGILLNWCDITKLVEMERNLEYISTHDELTNLPNRILLNKKLYHEIEKAKQNDILFALIMLDIDGLKYISDILGEQISNRLILQFHERLKMFFDKNVFISRYSDERFALLVSYITGLDDCEKLAKDIINLYEKPFMVDKYELDIYVNLGISICPNDANDLDRLKRHADYALTRSKEEGKNRYQFYARDMDIQHYKHFSLRNDLRKSIERNELIVYYQPMVNLETNQIIAVEALLRWEHPIWGMVSPLEFISIAEETGYIIDIGKWMLHEVCKDYKHWMDTGLAEVLVSINFSSIQLYEKGFVENILKTIEGYDINPNFLIMEIVESILIHNFNHVMNIINELRVKGIMIALDDFGTGFSSLQYLNRFTVDIIKLDKIFLKNFSSNETSAIIIKCVNNLCSDLSIKLLVEGIETFEQLNYLKKLGCHAGQGFLFSKPIPKEKLEYKLENHKLMPESLPEEFITNTERRKYKRISFHEFIEANLTIIKMNDKRINIGDTISYIKNIGPGGLYFIADMGLPINDKIMLAFSFRFMDCDLKLYGYPIWKKEIGENKYEYGLEFKINVQNRKILNHIMNQIN